VLHLLQSITIDIKAVLENSGSSMRHEMQYERDWVAPPRFAASASPTPAIR
jgi:hypothetical protein